MTPCNGAAPKAIVGAAHGFQHPTRGPLSVQDFSGGEQTVKRRLEALGFTVVVATPEAAVATQTAWATNPDGGGRAGPAVCNWIFQANPELYDLVNEVKQGTDDRRFAVNAHWRRINAGDRIWFRVTGQLSGLYPAGTAASRPYEHQGPFGKRYVDVSYDSWIEPPLLTVAIQGIHDLATYRPLTGSQGTNFIVPREIADKIEQLTRRRLVPVNRPSRPDWPACEIVPVEGQHVERYSFNGSSEQVSAERREQRLVLAYCHRMRQRGSKLGRLRIVPGGPGAPLYSDI
jgi:hypothetical protein